MVLIRSISLVLMSTHNICFCGEIRNIFFVYLLSRSMTIMYRSLDKIIFIHFSTKSDFVSTHWNGLSEIIPVSPTTYVFVENCSCINTLHISSQVCQSIQCLYRLLLSFFHHCFLFFVKVKAENLVDQGNTCTNSKNGLIQ